MRLKEANLKAHVTALQAENAELKAKNDEHVEAIDKWEGRVVELEKEKKQLEESPQTVIRADLNLLSENRVLEKKVRQLEDERDEARKAASQATMQLTNRTEGEDELTEHALYAKFAELVVCVAENTLRIVKLEGNAIRQGTELSRLKRQKETPDAGHNGTGTSECQAAEGTESTGEEA